MCHCAQISVALIHLLGCLAAGSSATPQIIRSHLAFSAAAVDRRSSYRYSSPHPPPPPPRGAAQPWITPVTSASTCGRAAVIQTYHKPSVPQTPPTPPTNTHATPFSPSLAVGLIPCHCFFAMRLSMTSPVLTRGLGDQTTPVVYRHHPPSWWRQWWWGKERKKERKTLPDGRTRVPVTSRSKQDGEIFTDNNLIKHGNAASSAVDNKHLICWCCL